MKGLLIGLGLLVSVSAIAKPDENTKSSDLMDSLRDSSPCWASNWSGKVYHSSGLSQYLVIEVEDGGVLGVDGLKAIESACYND